MSSKCFFFKAVKRFKTFSILCILMLISISIVYFLFSKKSPENETFNSDLSMHTLCVIVPYRNRFEELLQFVPHISKFLSNQTISFHILVINQIDEFRFNRGSLINVGFRISNIKYPECDYIVMHDVDLLPLNQNLSYNYPEDYVFHISSPSLHPRYHYQTFIGGILLITKKQFIGINGLSNRYWGWGLEDDELYMRLKEKNIKIFRPGKLATNYTNTFRHIHGLHRTRDFERCYNQTRVSSRRDRFTGVNNVIYKVVSMHILTIDEFSFELFNIKLKCDQTITPWCICPDKKLSRSKFPALKQ